MTSNKRCMAYGRLIILTVDGNPVACYIAGVGFLRIDYTGNKDAETVIREWLAGARAEQYSSEFFAGLLR